MYDDLDLVSWDEISEPERTQKMVDAWDLYSSLSGRWSAKYECLGQDVRNVVVEIGKADAESFEVCIPSSSSGCNTLAFTELSFTVTGSDDADLEARELVLDVTLTLSSGGDAVYLRGSSDSMSSSVEGVNEFLLTVRADLQGGILGQKTKTIKEISDNGQQVEEADSEACTIKDWVTTN